MHLDTLGRISISVIERTSKGLSTLLQIFSLMIQIKCFWVKQIHIELHRQGMQAHGLNGILTFAELLLAHFFMVATFHLPKRNGTIQSSRRFGICESNSFRERKIAKKRFMDALSTLDRPHTH